MGLFGSRTTASGSGVSAARTARYSSGWSHMSKFLNSRESLRLLDIGPTSAGNINFVTHLGHSIYMANLVEDSAKPEYLGPHPDDPAKKLYDARRYLNDNLDFTGRVFDVVTFWDTADYLPIALLQPVIDRIYDVMEPGGQILALFHAKLSEDANTFCRYHLTATDQVEMQAVGVHPMRQTFTNRQIEGLFQRFASYRFFLAKDTLREVIITR